MADDQWNWAALSQPAADADAAAPPSRLKQQQQPKHQPKQQRHPKQESQRQQQREKGGAEGDVEAFSRLRIRERAVAAEDLRAEMRGRRFIPLAGVDRVPRDTFTDDKLDWVTIGVLARKTMSKPTANGATFMVWGLADLDGTELGVFLFDDAYNSHWKQMEGAIVALLNATLMPATEKNKFAFKVTRAEEVVILGFAVDFGICKGTNASEGRCRLAVNTAKSPFCLHHIAAHFSKAGRGRQQLNNTVGNIRKTLFTQANQPRNISAGVYTSASGYGTSASAQWKPILSSKKRPRESGSGLAAPTVLSLSGSVIQKAPPTKAASTSALSSRAVPDRLQKSQPGGSALSALANASNPPRRVTRGDKVIALMAAKSAPGVKRLRTKKVDMIRFMNTGAKS